VGASAWRRSNGTTAVSTGKWYWEVTLGNAPYSPRGTTTSYNAFGFGLSTAFNSTTNIASATDAVYLADSGYYKNFSGSWTDGGTGFSSGDTLAVAVDLDANTFTFYRNNTLITTGTIGGTAGRELVPIIISYDGSFGVMDCNFGQRPFAYTPPTGFRSLCATNLPATAIGFGLTNQGDDYMNAVLYTGTGSPLSVTGVGFKPDWVWAKKRSAVDDHVTSDALRGVQKDLTPNSTAAEATNTNGLQSFDSDGFSIGSGSGAGVWGGNSGATYVAWCWKASNAAGVTNTAGTITSTVSANTTAGFSIVTYTGTGATATVGHGLGAVPGMIIAKRRSATQNWGVAHRSLSGTQTVYLDLTQGAATGVWNGTPTSTVFNITTDGVVNASGSTYVAYCFAPVAGYSAFGSYTGNGSTDGPFVFTNFCPRYVMYKRTDTTGNWIVYDTARNTYNLTDTRLSPNLADAEVAASTSRSMDILSNGFKLRGASVDTNASGGTYIYAAFAEFPFQFANAR
jgi:hypothetical protein